MLQMEQKDYKMEIICVLLKGNNHARNIAKDLNINHMTIIRKLNELLKDNVVDFNKNGRNQTYFLKDSAEAFAFRAMAEHYRLVKSLKKYPMLREVVHKLQNDSRISLAVIFGSYAKGNPAINSDIDLFIETNDSNLRKEYSFTDSRLSVKIGSITQISSLVREIIASHIIVKGVDEFYEEIVK